jgi:hypothetical protein
MVVMMMVMVVMFTITTFCVLIHLNLYYMVHSTLKT